MNFKIVDGCEKTFEDIYDDFEQEYLHTTILNDDLRKKYELSKKDFTRLTRLVKENNRIEKRPTSKKGFYKSNHGFNLSKKINGKIHYGGWIPESQKGLLQEAVEICENLKWDSEKCKKAIKELKYEGIHN